MKFLFLNQTFLPDIAATAQYLAQVTAALVERGHEVSVLASRRGYDRTAYQFSPKSKWNGVEVLRVGTTGFGKSRKWRRAIDFASFYAASTVRSLALPQYDVVVALTSPPLISVLGAMLAQKQRARFVYWVMDLNPDEAIAAGWLKRDSLAATSFERLSRFSLRRASTVVALDTEMQHRLAQKGIPTDKIHVIPPWTHDSAVNFDELGREQFRKKHGFEDFFVVMHSGNHSPCHPLSTLLQAASRFKGEKVLFCLVGGGSELKTLQRHASREQLANVRFLPYQPYDQLSALLSAADLHVIPMGADFIGIVHPCKIYNLLPLRAPLLYIGPPAGPIFNIVQELSRTEMTGTTEHGDVEGTADFIRCAMKQSQGGDSLARMKIAERYSEAHLLPQLVAVLENKSVAIRH